MDEWNLTLKSSAKKSKPRFLYPPLARSVCQVLTSLREGDTLVVESTIMTLNAARLL